MLKNYAPGLLIYATLFSIVASRPGPIRDFNEGYKQDMEPKIEVPEIYALTAEDYNGDFFGLQ